MAKSLPKLERETFGLKVFVPAVLFGWALIAFVVIIGIFVLSPVGASYWGENAKAVRDLAAGGSALLGDLAVLAAWPKILAPLTFLAVASFMCAIALGFAAIPGILNRRIAVLKQAVPLMGGN